MDITDHKLQHRQLGLDGKVGRLLILNLGITQDAAAQNVHQFDTVKINTSRIPLPTLGTGTYSRSGSIFTITFAGHGLVEADIGKRVWFEPTSGIAVAGAGVIASIPNADTYTMTNLTAIGSTGNMVHQWDHFCIPSGWTYMRCLAQTFWLYDTSVRNPAVDPEWFSHGMYLGGADYDGLPADDRPALFGGANPQNMCYHPTGPSGLIILPSAATTRVLSVVSEVGNPVTAPVSPIISPNQSVFLDIELF